MIRPVAWIRKEFLRAFPAMLYFFIVITLFNKTFGWIMEAASGIVLMSFSRTIISSIIIGKVIIIADNLPFMNIFKESPLVYNVVWKTFIYSCFGFLFVSGERIVPLFFKYHGIAAGWNAFINNVQWPRFWTAQIWMVVLLLFFVMFAELIEVIGRDKLKKIFFG